MLHQPETTTTSLQPVPAQAPPSDLSTTATARARQKLRRQAFKRRKEILHQRVLAHLHQVEEANRKKGCNLRRSLRLHIKECIEGFPPDKPLFKAILFGEGEYFLGQDEKEGGPLDGYRLLLRRSKSSRHQESDRSDDSNNPSLGSHQEESNYSTAD